MTINLTAELGREVAARVAAGGFASADEFVEAAVAAFIDDSAADEYEPGEFNRLVEEGVRDADAGNLVDGEAFFAELLSRTKVRASRP